jgi:nicotinate-nucleotide adenylyltransferase
VLAEQAREQLGLERVLWVPAGDPWRKSGSRVTAAEHRVEMVRRALEGGAAFEVSLCEVERAGPSYTVETLEILLGQVPAHELVFLLGTDALEDLPNWHEPQRVIELALIGAAARGGVQKAGEELERLLPGLGARAVWFDMPRLDISATDLRRRAAKGRSLRYLVPPAVEAYIAQHGLYRGV